MSREIILGVDIGTSSVKVLFIDTAGNILRRAEEKHQSNYHQPFHAEQKASDYTSALREISRKNAVLIRDVVAIGLSGQTPSVICVDEEGNALRPVLTWQDNRAGDEAHELESQFSNPLETVGTSLPWSASACPAKLFWLAKNEPEIVKRTRWVLQPKDFLGFHLTGEAISDPWSTKGICNVLSRSPIDNLLNFIGWSPTIMPELRDGYESRGTVTDRAAGYFHLPAGIPVGVGWSDAMSGMVAMGVMSQPTSFIITGTSAIVGASSSTPPVDGGELYVIPSTCAPLSVTYGPTQSSGSSVEWAAKLLGVGSDEFIDLALGSAATDLPVYLPYIDGERAPLWRPDLRGGFYGVSISATRADFSASVVEGISFAERQVVEIAEELNGSISSSIKLGGHAGNDSRTEKFRLKTLGRPIQRYEDTDTTTRGAAILAYAILTNDLVAATDALSYSPTKKEPSFSDKEYAQSKFTEFLFAQKQAIELADRKIGSY